MQCRENYLIQSVLSTNAILRLKIQFKMISSLRPDCPRTCCVWCAAENFRRQASEI